MLKTLLGIVLLAAAAAAGYGAWYAGSPVRIAKYPVEVEIPRGAGFRTAIEQLEKSGIAIRRYEFELLARAHGKVRDIKAGSYEILQPVTPLELLQKLTRGDVTQAEVRLLEGWTFAQFRAALDASPHLRHETTGMSDADILARLNVTEMHPEGLFFPDTYLFGKGASDLAVLRRSYGAMARQARSRGEITTGARPISRRRSRFSARASGNQLSSGDASAGAIPSRRGVIVAMIAPSEGGGNPGRGVDAAGRPR